jgi:hypothetical protein
MSDYRLPEQKKLIIQVAAAAMLPSLAFLTAVLTLIHYKYGIPSLLAALALSSVLVFVFAGRYEGLNTVLALIMGIPGGVVLALLYGAARDHRALSARGWIFIAGWMLLSAFLGFLAFHLAKKAAGQHPNVERKKAMRIVLAGTIVTVLAAMAIMVYLAKLAQVIE